MINLQMEFLELVKQRQSVRRFSDKAVEKEKLEKCLKAAFLAPSASNAQPWKYIVVDNPSLKNEIAEATYSTIVKLNKFVLQAPIVVVIVIEKANIKSRIGQVVKNIEYPLIDIGISAEHFCLQATELGLGTCMLGWFNEIKIKKTLDIPKNKKIGLLIALGYAPKDYKLRDKIRKDEKEVCIFNKY